MSEEHCCQSSSSVYQTLDELDFERGIWYAAQHNDIDRVRNLIEKNEDVNREDKAGYTALHYASRNGHLEMCKLLIDHRANVNSLTKCGKVSALHRCASMGHLDVFEFLLNSGAVLQQKDGDGKTVLHRAVEGGHFEVVKEILRVDPLLRNETDNKGKLAKDYSNISDALLRLLQ